MQGAERAPVRWPQLLVGAMCAAQFLNVANISSVNIALPDIAADLGFSPATLPWVVSAYLLTFAGFLLVSGKVADLVGRRRVLLAGLAVFAACTVLDAVAVGPVSLVAARAGQGLGAAMSIPSALGILTATFADPQRRSRAVAAFGAAGAVGFASGLVLGGVVSDPLGWRWVFGLTGVPALVLLALVPLIVPQDPPRRRGHVDLVGAGLGTAGLLGLVFALTNAARAGWGSPATVGALVAGAVLLAGFVLVQSRVREPLMPLGLWRRPNASAIMVVGFCNFAAWVGANYFLSLTLQRALGYSPLQAALALLPLAVGGLFFAVSAGRLLPRTGPRPLLLIGLAVYASGFVLLATIEPGTRYWPHVLVAGVLTVAGNAFTYVSSNVIALAPAGPDEQSLVGGLFNTAMQVGGALGLAVMSTVATSTAGAGPPTAGYPAAFWTALGLALLGLLVAAPLIRSPAATTPARP